MNKEKGLPGSLHEDDLAHESGLILYNDDVNTFEFVIECLIEVCEHEFEQAEQCAMIAHFKGKCHIKSGDYHTLESMYKTLTFKGLTVSIE